MAEHNKLGRKGEEAAARHLTSNGHQLLEQVEVSRLRIDIISLTVVSSSPSEDALYRVGLPRGRSTATDAAHGSGCQHLRENEPGG